MTCILSVIICTTGRNETLKRCLDSLNKQNQVNFQVIIVCRNQNDLSGLKPESYRYSVKMVLSPGRNLALARDIGWRQAIGQFVAWIDDDTEVFPGWAEAIIDIFRKDKTIGGISGPTIIPNDRLANRDVFYFHQPLRKNRLISKLYFWWFLDNQPFAVGKLFPSGAWSPGSNFPSAREIKEGTEVDYLEACNMALRRDLVRKAGGFDLAYRGTSEWSELDLAIRVKKLGYRLVFSPRVSLTHMVSVKGVYLERGEVTIRIKNFFRFYFRHLFKPNLSYLVKFVLYMVFLGTYYFYLKIKGFYGKNQH
jgi:GT2 family glycosyltransferase